MADQSESTHFQELFESALQVYERTTGVTLANMHSPWISRVDTLLQGRAQAFSDFQERDRMMKAIRTTLAILTPLSDASLADSVGLVRHKALKACSTSPTFFFRHLSHL